MVHIVVYLVTSYLVVILFVRMICLNRSRLNKGLLRSALLLLVLLLFFLPLLPYALVEGRTAIFGKILLPEVSKILVDTGQGKRIHVLKVLSFKKNYAKVYIVTPCEEGGGYCADVIDLENSKGRWMLVGDTYTTIWSDRGSASGNIFPPYPSNGDYH